MKFDSAAFWQQIIRNSGKKTDHFHRSASRWTSLSRAGWWKRRGSIYFVPHDRCVSVAGRAITATVTAPIGHPINLNVLWLTFDVCFDYTGIVLSCSSTLDILVNKSPIECCTTFSTMYVLNFKLLTLSWNKLRSKSVGRMSNVNERRWWALNG